MLFKKLWEQGGIIAVAGLSLVVRIVLLRWWSPFPFGDVFNFVAIARALAHGMYPVADKRLPFYPLLILMVHSVMPWLRWETVAIGIAITMSIVAIVLLYALALSLGLKKIPALVGALLFASYQPFLSYSIRGYADTTMVALVLAALLIVLHLNKKAMPWILGVVLGALALTRYEGAVAVIALVPFIIWQLRRRLLRLLPIIGVMLIIITPYIVIAYHSGHSVLPTTYLQQGSEEGRSYGADSWHEFTDRYYEIGQRLGVFALWQLPWAVAKTAHEDILAVPNQISMILADAASMAAVFALIGFIYLLWRQRFFALLMLFATFMAITIPIAWWAPYIRYDALLFPLIALLAAAGVHVLFTLQAGKRLRIIMASILLFVAVIIWMLGATQQTENLLRKTRYRDLALYQGIQAARQTDGNIAFETRNGLIDTYFGKRAIYADELFNKATTTAQRWQYLRDHDVHYTLAKPNTTTRSLSFLFAAPPGTTLTEVAHWQAEQGDHDSNEFVLYTISYRP